MASIETRPYDPALHFLRTAARPRCCICGRQGAGLYSELQDRLFAAPGKWDFRQCSACGLAWLDPYPIADDIAQAYANYYTHEEEASPRADGWIRRTYQPIKRGYLAWRYGYGGAAGTRKKFLAPLMYVFPIRRAIVDGEVLYLPAKEGGHLLDVGCGSGRFMQAMTQLGWQTQGLDTDCVAVDRARTRGLAVRCGELLAQQFPSDSFDAVVMNHVIEHVHDPWAIVAECHRILKPGGRLVIVTPNIKSWGHGLFRQDWRGLEPPRHLHLFSRSSLTALSRFAGFRHDQGGTTARAADGIILASLALRRSRKQQTPPAESRIDHWLAAAIQVAEWIGIHFRRDAGEELALTFVK